MRAQRFDQICIAVGLGTASKGVNVQTAQAQHERCEQSDRAGSHDRCLARLPDLQATLDLVSLVDAFLHDRHRFQQHADIFQSLRNLDDELDVVDVVLSQVAVQRLMPRSKYVSSVVMSLVPIRS